MSSDGCGYTTKLCRQAAETLDAEGISAEVVDLRVLNPLDSGTVIQSAAKTNRVLAVDGDWKSCGLAAEILALVTEHRTAMDRPVRVARVTHPDAPAPTSKVLEREFYFDAADVAVEARRLVG